MNIFNNSNLSQYFPKKEVGNNQTDSLIAIKDLNAAQFSNYKSVVNCGNKNQKAKDRDLATLKDSMTDYVQFMIEMIISDQIKHDPFGYVSIETSYEGVAKELYEEILEDLKISHKEIILTFNAKLLVSNISLMKTFKFKFSNTLTILFDADVGKLSFVGKASAKVKEYYVDFKDWCSEKWTQFKNWITSLFTSENKAIQGNS